MKTLKSQGFAVGREGAWGLRFVKEAHPIRDLPPHHEGSLSAVPAACTLFT
jgi:hypothetical protein